MIERDEVDVIVIYRDLTGERRHRISLLDLVAGEHVGNIQLIDVATGASRSGADTFDIALKGVEELADEDLSMSSSLTSPC